MDQLDQQVARRLTRFYIVALTVIAVLTVGGLLFVRRTLRNHYDDSRVVNVAGRQRMLSQRLTKLAVLRTAGMETADTVSFDSLLRTWARSHSQLRNGTLQMEKPYTVPNSAAVSRMLTRIEPVFQSIYQNFLRLNDPRTDPEARKEALRIVLRKEPVFLAQMNDIVFQFDTESFERVAYLERVEWFLAAATLLTLLIEGLLIFRPVVGHTSRVIRKLTESEEAIRRANNRLAVTNRQLITTQDELLRATREKYRLQIAEETVRSAALLEGQEEERRRFARELHDGIGQMLTGLKLHAEKLKTIPFPEPKHRQRFEELCALIYEVIQTTRQTSHNLMPAVLGDFGLSSALELLAEQTARATGRPVRFDGSRDGQRLSPPLEIGLYRIAQEALNNAVRHAEARTILIQLQHDPQSVELNVQDDGNGFEAGADRRENGLPPSNGIENMRTRARLLNGELTIRSEPGQGTTVTVHIPLADTSP